VLADWREKYPCHPSNLSRRSIDVGGSAVQKSLACGNVKRLKLKRLNWKMKRSFGDKCVPKLEFGNEGGTNEEAGAREQGSGGLQTAELGTTAVCKPPLLDENAPSALLH
jgi:hypothetical protein